MPIMRFFNADLSVYVEVNPEGKDYDDLHTLHWGPPMACTYMNEHCKIPSDSVGRKVSVAEAKAFLLECRARKYLSVGELPKCGRMFRAILEEGDIVELCYDEEASKWLGQDEWSRQDGEVGTFDATEIFGWTGMDAQMSHVEAASKLVKQSVELV